MEPLEETLHHLPGPAHQPTDASPSLQVSEPAWTDPRAQGPRSAGSNTTDLPMATGPAPQIGGDLFPSSLISGVCDYPLVTQALTILASEELRLLHSEIPSHQTLFSCPPRGQAGRARRPTPRASQAGCISSRRPDAQSCCWNLNGPRVRLSRTRTGNCS